MKEPSVPDGHTRIHFDLDVGEDDYPPAAVETVWGVNLAPNLYRLDNVPFFIRGVSLGDVVRTRTVDGVALFEEVATPSGNATIRLVATNTDDVARIRNDLAALGCTSELGHVDILIAANVPRSVDVQRLVRYLDDGERQGRFDVEEANVFWTGRG